MFLDWGGLLLFILWDKDCFLRIFIIVEWVNCMDGYWAKLLAVVCWYIVFYCKAWLLLWCLW